MRFSLNNKHRMFYVTGKIVFVTFQTILDLTIVGFSGLKTEVHITTFYGCC